MFGKSNKPSPIDSLIGTGTTIEGNISFTGGPAHRRAREGQRQGDRK
jgi:hypothetical protein